MNIYITALRAGPPIIRPFGPADQAYEAKPRWRREAPKPDQDYEAKPRWRHEVPKPPRASAALGAAQLRRFASPSFCLASLDLFCASYLWYSAFSRVGFASALFKKCLLYKINKCRKYPSLFKFADSTFVV